MNYLNQKQGFLGYDNNLKIDNKVVIVPFGLERSVSYGGGTKKGPKVTKQTKKGPNKNKS